MAITLSIIVPVCNAAAYLPEMLKRFRECPDAGLELCLEDDGSIDRTGELCRTAEAGDPRVHYCAHMHTGRPGAMRNAGLRHAANDYVFLADADDEWDGETLTRLADEIGRMEAVPDVVCLAAEGGARNDAGLFVPNDTIRALPFFEGMRSGRTLLAEAGRRNWPLASQGWLNLYRRRFLLEHELFQPENFSLREDHAWMLKVLFFAEQVAASKMKPYRYIRHVGSVSLGNGESSLTDAAQSVRDLAAFFTAHRAKMNGDERIFWSRHTVNGIDWYFFNPMYFKRFPRKTARRVLRRVFAEKSARADFAAAAADLPMQKRVGARLIGWAMTGGAWIFAGIYFRIFYRLNALRTRREKGK